MSLATIWTEVLSHLWQSSLVLLGLLGLARLLRGAPARYEHALWTVGLLKLALPLAVGGALVRALFPSAGTAGFALDTVWVAPAAGLAPALSGDAGGRVVALLTLAWVAGSGFLLFRLAREQVGAARLGRGSRPPRGAELDLVEAARRGTSVPRQAVRVTDAPVGPAVVGLFRPVILLGLPALRLPRAELRVILEHEDAHRRRRDPARTLARRVVAALLFFYPPIVPLMRRLHETAEFAADEHALRATESDLLVRALARVVGLGLAAAPDPAASGNAALLSRRFERLANPRRRPMPVHRLALVFGTTLALAVSLLPVASAEDAAAEEEAAFDTPPSVTHQVAPVYPEDSRQISGRVVVELTVNTDGLATDLAVLESIEDHPEFTEAATEALTQWRFSPARKDGRAVDARIIVPIRFEPSDTHEKPDADTEAEEAKARHE